MNFIKKIKSNKLLYFLGILIVGLFIVLIVRFTYAYLALNVNEASENVTLDSDETDKLNFDVGDPLSINATPSTLPENGENLVDTTSATATLLANTTNNTAEYPYWVYFTISNNTFVYSDGSTPEIILTITDPDGNPITNIDGLTYGTFNGVAGFDVTTQNGTFAVADGYTITSNSSTEETVQTWNFTLTYLNLSIDQSINFGNSMTTEIKMQKEKNKVVFADYITSQVYTGVDGENDLYYHDGVGTYTNADQEAGDNSYRYSGANPNNYVCFGSDEETCPDDNLYRIIGVFDGQVKLIKNVAFSTIQWDSNDLNNWQSASLNLNTFNGTFLNSFDDKWTSKISNFSWKIGGNRWTNLGTVTAKNTYINEIVSPSTNTTYSSKIGLMYVSDYGYATNPENWNITLINYNTSSVTEYNWLYQGIYEWFLVSNVDMSNQVLAISNDGAVNYYNSAGTGCSARPVFYLNSDVFLENGSGTVSDPYRIA